MSIPESHLAQEAIAALVDGELSAGPAGRAARHLSGCLQCRLAVEAQREAKAALHRSREFAVPGDLLSRLRAIPFTTEVPGSGGGLGDVAAGPSGLTVSDRSGAWSVDLRPQERRQRPQYARWLRRGVTGTMIGLGVAVTFLALNLPASGAPTPGPGRSAVDRPGTEQRTDVVPPVVRSLTVGTSGPGGTP